MDNIYETFSQRGLLGLIEDFLGFRTPETVTFRLIAIFFGLGISFISYKYISNANRALREINENTYPLQEGEDPKVLVKQFKSQKRIGYYVIIIAVLFLLSGLLPS